MSLTKVTYSLIEGAPINALDYGADPTGVEDSTSAIQSAINYVKTNGGKLYIPTGTYKTGALNIGNATKYFEIVGAGRGNTLFKHKDGNGTLLNGTANANGLLLQGFSIDCEYSTYSHPNANHGVAISDTNRIKIVDVFVTDYKNSAILVFATVPTTYSDVQLIDCEIDGLNAANNGILAADVDRPVFERCTVRNLGLTGSPGYGIQFKNVVRWGAMNDCFADTCVAGIAFGNDSGVDGVQFATLNNLRVVNCTTGFVASRSKNNAINNLFIDMNSSVENALDLEIGCVGNSFKNVIVNDVNALRAASRFRSGASDNYVHFGAVDNINTTGVIAAFNSGAQYNLVELARMTNPRIRSGGVATMATFSTAADGNGFSYSGLPMWELRTIASGVITLRNKCSTSVLLATEGGAASDDLDTITAEEEGRTIIVSTESSARDVVVKNGTGNILLDGSDCTLNNAADSLTLKYSAVVSAWVEVSRAVSNGA